MNITYLRMLPMRIFLTIIILFSGLVFFTHAHEGHQHEKETPSENSLVKAPTLIAVSENYELVALVQAGQITVYLDQFQSNIPVVDANLTLDISGTIVKPTRTIGGTYVGEFPKTLQLTSNLPVTVTILAAAGSDLLSGELVVANSAAPLSKSTDRLIFLAAGGVLILLLIYFIYRRKQRLQKPIKQKLPATI